MSCELKLGLAAIGGPIGCVNRLVQQLQDFSPKLCPQSVQLRRQKVGCQLTEPIALEHGKSWTHEQRNVSASNGIHGNHLARDGGQTASRFDPPRPGHNSLRGGSCDLRKSPFFVCFCLVCLRSVYIDMLSRRYTHAGVDGPRMIESGRVNARRLLSVVASLWLLSGGCALPCRKMAAWLAESIMFHVLLSTSNLFSRFIEGCHAAKNACVQP